MHLKHRIRDILPEYPSIFHLPYKSNCKGKDRIATELDANIIFTYDKVYIQEKIDGANCGMAYIDGHPVVRNRTKILRKGQELKNPSTKQFASAWNWMHDNKEKFDELATHGDYSVYGEWLIQSHGQLYDALPDWFIAYDLYDWLEGKYIDPVKSNFILNDCGFKHIPFTLFDSPLTYEKLEEFANLPSSFGNVIREGIVVKVGDGQFTTKKFKMVRQDFQQGILLSDEIKFNEIGRHNEKKWIKINSNSVG